MRPEDSHADPRGGWSQAWLLGAEDSDVCRLGRALPGVTNGHPCSPALDLPGCLPAGLAHLGHPNQREPSAGWTHLSGGPCLGCGPSPPMGAAGSSRPRSRWTARAGLRRAGVGTGGAAWAGSRLEPPPSSRHQETTRRCREMPPRAGPRPDVERGPDHRPRWPQGGARRAGSWRAEVGRGRAPRAEAAGCPCGRPGAHGAAAATELWPRRWAPAPGAAGRGHSVVPCAVTAFLFRSECRHHCV